MKFNSFDELDAHYETIYGEDWGEYGTLCLESDEQQIEWLNAFYDIFPKLYKLRETFVSSCDEWVIYNGKQFEIVSPIYPDDECDFESLPSYRIKFTDTNEIFVAFGDEIFEV